MRATFGVYADKPWFECPVGWNDHIADVIPAPRMTPRQYGKRRVLSWQDLRTGPPESVAKRPKRPKLKRSHASHGRRVVDQLGGERRDTIVRAH